MAWFAGCDSGAAATADGDELDACARFEAPDAAPAVAGGTPTVFGQADGFGAAGVAAWPILA